MDGQDPHVALPTRRRPRAAALQGAGVLTGKVAALDADGTVRVEYSDATHRGAYVARAIVAVHPSDVGREVVLALEGGSRRTPIILGFLQPIAPSAPVVAARLDGETIVLEAAREIVLQCGKASITLTRAGKVLIRGEYVLSRSSGVNRIKGGAVQIN
jgi:hypothetical protein